MKRPCLPLPAVLIHEVTKYCSTTNVLPPENYPLYGIRTCIYMNATYSMQGGCAFVAAVLHYLFLASFCWMLCEGVMLYLMLVLVFTQLKDKWWFFLLLGYCKLLNCPGNLNLFYSKMYSASLGDSSC